jgi:hypothetical protein
MDETPRALARGNGVVRPAGRSTFFIARSPSFASIRPMTSLSPDRPVSIAHLPPLRFVLTRADLTCLISQNPKVRRHFVFAKLFLLGFGAPWLIAVSACLLAVAKVLGYHGESFWIVFLAIGLAALVPLFVIHAILWRGLASEYAGKRYLQPREITFTADGFIYREGVSEAHIPWGAVRRATDLRDVLLLHLSYRPDLAIPHRAFACEEQRQQLFSFLSGVFGVPIEVPEPGPRSSSPDTSWLRRPIPPKWLAIGGFCLFIGATYLIITWR